MFEGAVLADLAVVAKSMVVALRFAVVSVFDVSVCVCTNYTALWVL